MALEASHLILVPAHAAFAGDVHELPADFRDDRPWILQSFQTGEPPRYIEHIETGIDLLRQDPANGLLMFTGGLTRPNTHWTEAATYYQIAEHLLLQQPGGEQLLGRVAVEGFARDSFENIAFSRERFLQLVGHYPVSTVVVGWGFKEDRFKLHAKELAIDGFSYVNRNNPEGEALAAAEAGEAVTRADFIRYPRGDGGKPLQVRQARSFSTEPIPYEKYRSSRVAA